MRFEDIYDACADSVYAWLRYRVRDPGLLEDIFQETFLSVYRQLDKAAEAESLKAWVIRIAHRRMVEHFRKLARIPPSDVTASMESVDGTIEPSMLDSLIVDEFIRFLNNSVKGCVYLGAT